MASSPTSKNPIAPDRSASPPAVQFPVYTEIANQIRRIAKARDTEAESLVNDILRDYVARKGAPEKPIKNEHAQFLLNMAGLFNSGERNTSENVGDVLKDFFVEKHRKRTTPDDRSD